MQDTKMKNKDSIAHKLRYFKEHPLEGVFIVVGFYATILFLLWVQGVLTSGVSNS